jgi:hypothetical protein
MSQRLRLECACCPPSDRLGRIQRQVQRATIARPGTMFTTTQLLQWAYPKATAFERSTVAASAELSRGS